MANGHVEIHDPFSNHNGLSDPKSTSDSDSMEDTAEFRLLMAYAKRRRPKKQSQTQDSLILVTGGSDANGSTSPQTPANTEKEEKKERKKKKIWKRLPGIFKCIKAQTEAGEPCQTRLQQPDDDYRCGGGGGGGGGELEILDEYEVAAGMLTKIADEIPFTPPEVETDAPEDMNVEKMIGLLLRETGDQVNEKELKDSSVATELFWDYRFFKLLMTTLLTRMGLRSPDPDSPGPKASPKSQIAVACEVTSRLSAVNTLPGNLLLKHGARYLQDYYSTWVQQQGGYDEAFYSDDEDDQ